MIFKMLKGGFLTGAALMAVSSSAMAEEPKTLAESDKHIITVAAYTAIGDMESLRPEFSEALSSGLTVMEIREILVQMYAYAGFPRSLNGLNAFISVLDDRKAKGIEELIGKEATPLPEGTDMEAYGNKVRNEIVGADLTENTAAWAQFAPVIDHYLKAHLFGDIFARDVLTYQQRELATIGALAALDGTESQLGSHLNVSLNVGITPDQLYNFIEVIEESLGAEKAAQAQTILDDIVSKRKKD